MLTTEKLGSPTSKPLGVLVANPNVQTSLPLIYVEKRTISRRTKNAIKKVTYLYGKELRKRNFDFRVKSQRAFRYEGKENIILVDGEIWLPGRTRNILRLSMQFDREVITLIADYPKNEFVRTSEELVQLVRRNHKTILRRPATTTESK